jgi:hypothetical protein
VRVEPKQDTYLTGLDELTAHAERLRMRLLSLDADKGSTGPPLPGFEPPPAAAGPRGAVAEIPGAAAPIAADPRGWSAGGDPSIAVAIDRSRPHDGQAALRLDARALPASAASDPFLPPGGTELTVGAWLRADRADAKVRVRIEGEAAGRPVVRQVEVPVGAEWARREVRVPNLPAGGLDRLSLRFEWLGPATGTLWVDDVNVAGQGPSESGRRVKLILTDALAAFTQGQYAQFARLTASHHARPILPEAAPGPVRTGRANDLPPRRVLR